MPMFVYTEDEVIEQCNKAEAEGAAKAGALRDEAQEKNRRLRKLLSDIDTTMQAHGKVDAGTPLHSRIQHELESEFNTA